MAEEKGRFKLKKMVPPFGTPESPIWEFGYDEQVRVVGGLCIAKSPAMRDRLIKMGYELAAADEAPPAGAEPEAKTGEAPKEPQVPAAPAQPAESSPPATASGSAEPAAVVSDPAAAPEEQPKPGNPSGGA